MLGYTFTLDEARSLLGLSIFDANHNGINDNPRAAQVGVWRRDNQQLVASVDVPADAPVVDGWFGSELATFWFWSAFIESTTLCATRS